MSEDNKQAMSALRAEVESLKEELRAVRRALMAAEKLRHASVAASGQNADRVNEEQQQEMLLASGIAHEFNNILGAADGHAEWGLDSGKLEDMKEALEVVRMACARSLQITRGLQGIQGPQEEEVGLFSLAELMKSLKRDTKPLIEKAGATLFVDVEDGEIYGNSGRLYEVCLNLLKNSVEAFSEQKAASAAELRLLGRSSDAGYTLLFLDNGPGIPSVMATQIFAPFFTTKGQMAHVHSSEGQNQGQGSGLGLYLCRKIVNEMGGRLEVLSKDVGKMEWESLEGKALESELKVGAVFKLQLPRV